MVTEADVGTEGEAALLLEASASSRATHHLPRPAARILRRLLVAVVLFITATAMTIPVRPRLILDAASNDSSLASYYSGMVDSLQAILTIFTAPLFGAVSDVVGRKPILVLSHLGELTGLLVVASCPSSLAFQFPAYMLIAVTNSYVTTANTIVADLSNIASADMGADDARVSSTANFGYLGAAFGVSFLIGPTLGGLIEDYWYLASSFHVACVLIVIAVAYVATFLPETKQRTIAEQPSSSTEALQPTASWWRRTGTNVSTTAREVTDAIRATQINPLPRARRIFAANEAMTWIAITIATASLAQGGLNAIMFLYLNKKLGWDTKETGFFLSMVGLSVLIAQGLLAPLAVRLIGEVPTILMAYALSALHYLLYALANTTETMYFALFIGMFGFTVDPVLKGLLARQVSIDSQGSLQGSLSAITSVVRPVAPVISSALFGFGNAIGRPGLPFIVLAVIASGCIGFARIAFWKDGLK